MELDLDEQPLIAAYRKLSDTGKRELASLACALQAKYPGGSAEEAEGPAGSCKMKRQEERPETASEPICTE